MNNVEYRQFLTELDFIRDKYNKSFIGKIIPSLDPLKSAKEILIKTRKAYDFSVAELLKKYRIDYSDMYKDFDNTWNAIDDSAAIGKVEIAGPQRIVKMQSIINNYFTTTYLYCRRKAVESLEKKN